MKEPTVRKPVPGKPEIDPDMDPATFRVGEWPLHYLLAIERGHVRNMGLVLAPFGCSPLVWRILSILNEQDGQSIGYLSEISVIERSNLSRVIDSMERAGLVSRDDGPTDRRQTRVFITEQGRAEFQRTLPSVLRYYAKFLEDITDDEFRTLISILRRIKANVGASQVEVLGW